MRRRCCCDPPDQIPARGLTATVHDVANNLTWSLALNYGVIGGLPRWAGSRTTPTISMTLDYGLDGTPRLAFGAFGVSCVHGNPCSPPTSPCSTGGIYRVGYGFDPFVATFSTLTSTTPLRSCCCAYFYDITITE